MVNIIAELCQNHNGDLKILDEMVAAAAEAKADYVKIQSMRSSDLTFRKRFEKGLIEGGRVRVLKRPYLKEFNRLKKLDLTDDHHFKFIGICKKYKIKPMTSVFSLNRIQFLKKIYQIDTLKVPSFDCASYKMIEKLSKIKKKLIISTGGTFDREIEKTSNILKKNKKKFTFLHCISIYPTPLNEANLSRISYLKNFTNSVGISDHSNPDKDSHKLSISAVHLGANTIERHFTILKKNKTRDGIVSVNFKQLKELCEQAKSGKKNIKNYVKYEVPEFKLMIGKQHRELSESELINRDYYQGRFSSKNKRKIIFNW